MERDMISLNMYTNVDINADMDMGRCDEYGRDTVRRSGHRKDAEVCE